MLRTFGATALVMALLSAPVFVQAQPSKDAAAAAAGAYKMDTNHTSVVARIGHGGGFSYSNFRFGKVTGTLAWNPAAVEKSKVTVVLDTKSIQTPVAGFADELAGDRFLNAAKYPEARFVSTSIRKTSPTKGLITGDLTFMGVTKPITIDAELVGAGKNMMGRATVGFTGTAKFKRSDYGFTAMVPMIGDEVTLVIDTEFTQG